MQNIKIYDLPTMSDRRKSFYGKAKVIENTNGDIELLSYDTIVCRIKNGVFEKLWDGYSQTTMRHIKAFTEFCSLNTITKKEWDAMPLVS